MRVSYFDHINQIPSSHDHIKQLPLYIVHQKFGLNIQLSVMKPGQVSMGLNMHLLVLAVSFDMLGKFGKGQKLSRMFRQVSTYLYMHLLILAESLDTLRKSLQGYIKILRKFQHFQNVDNFRLVLVSVETNSEKCGDLVTESK